MKKVILLPLFLVLALGVGIYSITLNNSEITGDAIKSQVISLDDIDAEHADWGTAWAYTNLVKTYGTEDMLTLTAAINPGDEIHPPHVHVEEEFLLVLEGEGTWHLNGKAFPAKTGDLLYAEPWDIHGIKNTGTEPMKFFVVKWNNKGVEKPEKP